MPNIIPDNHDSWIINICFLRNLKKENDFVLLNYVKIISGRQNFYHLAINILF